MIVYLLRHGNAEDHAPGGDDARQLTADGVAKLERAAKGWRRIVSHLDHILASPLVRAQQTAAIFQRAVAPGTPIGCERALEPSARPLDALVLLQACQAAGHRGTACIGHEPHLGHLLGLLLTGSARAAIPFKKGLLVAVEIEGTATMVGRLVAAASQRVAGEM